MESEIKLINVLPYLNFVLALRFCACVCVSWVSARNKSKHALLSRSIVYEEMYVESAISFYLRAKAFQLVHYVHESAAVTAV